MSSPSAKHAEVNDLVSRVGVPEAGSRLGVAAILYTYQCTIACRHCCFASSRASPAVRMTAEKIVRHLRSLHQLGRVIHVAGGECMMHWDDLRRALAAARDQGVAPHFVETNCSFADSDAVARQRVEELLDLGVVGLLLSADPYHQASVPAENVLRVRRIARQLMGPENVWCTNEPDERVREFARIARDPSRLREVVRAHPPMLVGTAHRELRRYLDDYPLAEMPLDVGWRRRHTGWDCAIEFRSETMWELHVDPYDNIQTNCGVILGSAAETDLARLMRAGPDRANFVAEVLSSEGPRALAELARNRHGFAPPERACTKCDLCYTTRKFLRAFHPDILGPAEVYEA